MPFYNEGTRNEQNDPLLKVLMKVLMALRTLATNLFPSIDLSSPSFYLEGSTPVLTDTKYKVAQKILGVLNDLNDAIGGAGGGGGAGCSVFSRRRSGVGDPNGSVSGCVGETYIDTSTGQIWAKVSGANTTTGWS
jgi:hypothetical protein